VEEKMTIETLAEIIETNRTIQRILKTHSEMPLHGGNGLKARLRELLNAEGVTEMENNRDLASLLAALNRLDRAVRTVKHTEVSIS
jgi:hypothetical protein